MAKPERTVAIEKATGKELATYPGILKLVRAGENFYVGQEPWHVDQVVHYPLASELLVYLSKREKR